MEAPVEPPSEVSREPWPPRLRWLGYVFLFLGVYALVGTIRGLLESRFSLNLAILCIPAGYLAAAGRTLWRRFMLFIAGLLFIGTGIVVLVIGYVVVLAALNYRAGFGASFFLPYQAFPKSLAVGSWTLFFLVCLGLNTLSTWMFLVLRGEEARRFSRPGTWRAGPVERSARVGLALTTALVVAVCAAEWVASKAVARWADRQDYGPVFTVLRPNRIVCYSYGLRFGQLAYAVLEESEGSLTSAVSGESGSDGIAWKPRLTFSWSKDRGVFLRPPEGKQMRLPNQGQLYEIVDGVFRARPERVSKDQFEAFVHSKPERYTLDGLLEFAKTSRAMADNATH